MDYSEGIADKDLEELVFGGKAAFFAKLNSTANAVLAPKKEESDSEESSDDEGPEEIPVKPTTSKISDISQDRKPVWVDEDDEKQISLPSHRKLKHLKLTTDKSNVINGAQYTARLKESFERKQGTVGRPAWAERKPQKTKFKDEDSDDEESDLELADLTRRTGNFIGSTAYLPKETLEYKKMQDLTFGHKKKKAISAVEFNRESRVALVGSEAQSISLYEIDGDKNPLLQSVALDRFPVHMAKFSADGCKVFAGCKLHSYFWCYDMLDGKASRINEVLGMEQTRTDKFSVSPDGEYLAFQGRFGAIHLLSAKSFEWIGNLKMNGNVRAISFSSDSRKIYSIGEEGQVYIWDVNSRRNIHRFFDEGCIRGTAVALTEDGKKLATGSNTGVVNIYKTEDLEKTAEPKPIKRIMNLTTAIDSLQFSPNGEILGLASSEKNGSIRLVHVGSKTVFTNFPGRKSKMYGVKCLDFSPNAAYLSVGNEEGRALLYRLQHYKSY